MIFKKYGHGQCQWDINELGSTVVLVKTPFATLFWRQCGKIYQYYQKMLQTLAGNFQFEWYILKKESDSYKEYILILYRKNGGKNLKCLPFIF